MDKLGCSIKTLTFAEASHFKSYLRLKAKGQTSKKEKLFLHLLNGNQSVYIRKQLYSGKESDSAYYHLRKGLLEDLENFLVLDQFKKNEIAQLQYSSILGKRAAKKGENDLAMVYFNAVVADTTELSKGLKIDVKQEKRWLHELDFKLVYQQYKSDMQALSIIDLIAKYPISFLVSLKKRDVMPVIQDVIQNQVCDEGTVKDNKLLFIKAYGLYVFRRYNESMDVVNLLIQQILLADNDEIVLNVWAHLLKMFIFSRRGQFSHAIVQFRKIEQSFFHQLGTQYQLLILRWSLVMHVHANNLNRTTEIIKQLLKYQHHLRQQLGKRQTHKLLVFIAGFAKSHYRETLYEMMVEAYAEDGNLPAQIVDNNSALDYVDRLLKPFFNGFSQASFLLKTPENILLQHARLKQFKFELPLSTSFKKVQDERV
jgi:hypothetical protein